MKDIDIQLYDPKMADEWDDYVWQSNGGTLFHTRHFLSYHPKDRFKDHSLIFYKSGRRAAQMPAVDIEYVGKKTLFSHRGASYGGLIYKDQLGIREAFDYVQALIAYAKENGFQAIDLTPPPYCYYDYPNDYLEFALVQNGFVYRKREISSVITLNFPASDILSTFKESSRRAVRKARKMGVVVRESDDYARFYEILKKNLRLRHNVTPTHTLNELIKIRDLYPDRVRLFAAFHEQDMIAGVVMFDCNPLVTLAFYISHDESFQQYRGVNVLFHEIVAWSIQRGFRSLDFGIFTVDEDPNWGLARFKESFGAQGIFRNSLRIEL